MLSVYLLPCSSLLGSFRKMVCSKVQLQLGQARSVPLTLVLRYAASGFVGLA